jgi:hypothetical protein
LARRRPPFRSGWTVRRALMQGGSSTSSDASSRPQQETHHGAPSVQGANLNRQLHAAPSTCHDG